MPSPKVICICGKICCGKSTYAQKLRIENKAVILSIDEITLSLFGQHLGEKHDEITGKTQEYLLQKSVEIIETGINVILDWGFWLKKRRDDARNFFADRGIECEFHYIDISDEVWQERLAKRNKAVSDGETSAYFVDDNLAAKFESLFEAPDKDEIDIWIQQ